MGSRFVILVLAIVASSTAMPSVFDNGNGKDYQRGTPGFLYDCSGKVDGDYNHPTKCDHFVACVAGTEAYEMPCAMGHGGVRLHYVQGSGPSQTTSRCDYPEVAGCSGPAPELTTAATPEPTTAATPEPTTPATPAPTTAATPAPTTAATTQTPPVEGDDCYPDDCHTKGYCTDYYTCNSDTNKWDKHSCGQDLFWNNNAAEIHGGNCDFFGNLAKDDQDKLKGDSSCIKPCEWYQTKAEECSGSYLYREKFDDFSTKDRVTALECPTFENKEGKKYTLYWIQSSLTCDRAAKATDLGGNSCGLSD